MLRTRTAILCLLPVLCFGLSTSFSQQIEGSIVGHIRVSRGDVPSQRLLVTLELRGATMDSVYTDDRGTFGFHRLAANPYYIVVNDDQYQPFRQEAIIDPSSLSPTVLLEITLMPKQLANAPAAKALGSNPNLTDVREYSQDFPNAAVKEFKKGSKADRDGKREEAIQHYRKAIAIAPNFYPAHNNLGSDLVANSDFAGARAEFEQVLKLNESDAAAYFNLGNACMQMGELEKTQGYLLEGLRRQPDSALGYFLQGSLNIRQGRVAEGEIALRHAIELNPAMVQPRLQLVNLFLKVGKKQDAEGELRTFIHAFPDNPFTPQAKQLLGRLEAPAKPSNPKPN